MIKFLELSNDILTRKYYAMSDIETMEVLPQLYKYYQETGRMVVFLQRSLVEIGTLEAIRAGYDKAVERAVQQDGMLGEIVSIDGESDASESTSVLYAISMCMSSAGLTHEEFLKEYKTFLCNVADALYVFLGYISSFCFDMSMGAFVAFLAKNFKTVALKDTTIAVDLRLVPRNCSIVYCKTNVLDICRQYMPYVHSVYMDAVKQGLPIDSIADSWWGCGKMGWLSTAGHATYQSKQTEQDKLWVLLCDATRYLTNNAIGALIKYLKIFDLELEVPIAE